MDGGAPQLSSSSLPMSPEESSPVTPSNKSPQATIGNSNSALSPESSNPHENRLLHRLSGNGSWSMNGGAPQLGAGASSLSPNEPTRSSLGAGNSSSSLTPEAPKRERRLSQRLSASFSSAVGSG